MCVRPVPGDRPLPRWTPLPSIGADQVAEGGCQGGPAAFEPGVPVFESGDPLGELADLDEFAFDAAEGAHDVAVGGPARKRALRS